MKRKQKTIAKEVSIGGKGLHTGVETSLTLRSAEVDTGLVIRLETEEGSKEIPLNPRSTGPGLHRTVAKSGEIEIQTIEHLLAALAGCEVDNVYIELTAAELPGLDGSASEFVKIIQEAGVVEQEGVTNPIVLQSPVTVFDGQGGIISAVPYSRGLKLTYTIHYPESKLAQGMCEFEINPDCFAREIAPARTFCLHKQVEVLLKEGCGEGASTENTLVLFEDSVKDNELRFSNECARHKLLDLLGDLAVLGRPLCMQVTALRSGHGLNAKFVQELTRRILKQENPKGILDIREIMNTLPHRYPFVLVDRILELNAGESVLGLKNITRNEEFFEGHFPGLPVMPGVLQIEAMAQTAGIMLLRREGTEKGLLAVLMGIDGIKFRAPVVPGDQLMMYVKMERCKGRMGQVKAVSKVDGKICTEATIKFALVDAKSYT